MTTATTKKQLILVDRLRIENIQMRSENLAMRGQLLLQEQEKVKQELAALNSKLVQVRSEFASVYGLVEDTIRFGLDGSIEGVAKPEALTDS